MSWSDLAFILTGPDGSHGLCPYSWRQIFDKERFDLSLCWIDLFPLAPLAILLPFGAAEAWSLRKSDIKRLSGWRGLGLYRLKLVRRRSYMQAVLRRS